MKLNFGFNVEYFDMSEFRGLNTDDFRFTFFASDLNGDGVLGTGVQSTLETETIDVFPNMDLNASVFTFFATFGLTSNFDIGFAVPIINVSLQGQARAVINSTSFLIAGRAANSFNGDGFQPQLETTFDYDESTTGIGDVSLRLKYRFLRRPNLDMGAFVDVRIPTGDEADFLSTGETNVKFAWLISNTTTSFSPHLVLAYDRRSADFDSDEFEFFAGFDQKVTEGLTFVLDVLGEYDLSSDKIVLFPGTRTLNFNQDRQGDANFQRNIEISNIPEDDRDNMFSASLGLKYAPSERYLLFANTLISFHDGGLRSNLVPVFGAAVTF